MLLMKNPKVQEAVIEKGIEVAGKLVDKQLKIIDEAQEKAENFLKKEVRARLSHVLKHELQNNNYFR